VIEIGPVYGPNSHLFPAGTARNGKTLSAPAQSRPIESTAALRQVRLPVEDAVREVARNVLDYIVTNSLTRDEGYQAFKAELVSGIPLAMLSINEMELVDKLSQELLNSVTNNPQNITMAESGPIPVDETGEGLMAGNFIDTPASDRSEQIPEILGQMLAKAPALAQAGLQQSEAGLHESPGAPMGQAPVGSEERLAMSWTLGETVAARSGLEQNANEDSIMRLLSTNGFLSGPMSSNSPLVPLNRPDDGSEIVPATQPSEGGEDPAINAAEPSLVAPASVGAPQQTDAGRPSTVSNQSPNFSYALRVDLTEILGGKPAELRIRYDEALIVSKVAVLLEQMNGLARVYEEPDRAVSPSMQKPLLNVNLSLRQVLAAALGIVIDGNKAFNSPASIGISAGRDGLLKLDPALLKGALESHRDETVMILKSMANSFYDNIGLYVDPRILARFSELLGIDMAGRAERSKKASERRWKKDKEALEKRFLELTLILEESGKLRDWFMNVVESLGSEVSDAEPSDEVSKRPLPAVDLAWDQEEILTFERPSEELKEKLVTLFIGCTSRALQDEDADASIKLLLKRKSLSDQLLSARPDLESKVAMVCLANEELVIGRIEDERRKLFKNLDELSRTAVAARGYRSQFPFPPPMAAFITSEG